MERVNVVKRYKEVDGEVVMENGNPIWEEVRIPYTPEEEAKADRRHNEKISKVKKRKEDLENLRIKLNLTEKEFSLLVKF